MLLLLVIFELNLILFIKEQMRTVTSFEYSNKILDENNLERLRGNLLEKATIQVIRFFFSILFLHITSLDSRT